MFPKHSHLGLHSFDVFLPDLFSNELPQGRCDGVPVPEMGRDGKMTEADFCRRHLHHVPHSVGTRLLLGRNTSWCFNFEFESNITTASGPAGAGRQGPRCLAQRTKVNKGIPEKAATAGQSLTGGLQDVPMFAKPVNLRMQAYMMTCYVSTKIPSEACQRSNLSNFGHLHDAACDKLCKRSLPMGPRAWAVAKWVLKTPASFAQSTQQPRIK